MVSWYLGKTTTLEGVACRGLDGMKSSEGQVAEEWRACQARGTPPVFPSPFPCLLELAQGIELVSNPRYLCWKFWV